MALFEQVAQQDRDARNPNAVIGGIRLVKAVFFKISNRVDIGRGDGALLVCIGGDRVVIGRHVVHGEGLLVLNADHGGGLVGGERLQVGDCLIGVEVVGGRVNVGLEGLNGFQSGRIFVAGVAIGGRADAEQMPAVAEHAVVHPVGRRRADRDHGDVIDQEHHDREDWQTQPTVRDDAVDLIGGGELPGIVLLVAGLDDRGDIHITLVRNDRLGVVVQLLFGVPDVLLDVSELLGIRFSFLSTLSSRSKILIAYQRCCSSGHIVHGSLLDVGDCVLDAAGEGVLRDGLGVFPPHGSPPRQLP